MTIQTGLPPRYEIRALGPEHVDWACAIFALTTLFDSPLWPAVYPTGRTARLRDVMRGARYLVQHQVDSGYSLGVFDKDFRFKRDGSEAAGGKLYWDDNDTEADAGELLEQMDFPLVSIALAYDGAHPLDKAQMQGLIEALPLVGTFYAALERLDPRPRDSWAAKRPGELLLRNATNTRGDYAGKGLMKKMAQFMMHQAAERGFRGIQIETASDAVERVWANPPPNYSAVVVSAFHTRTLEETDDKGDKVYPFRPAEQRATKIYCSLR